MPNFENILYEIDGPVLTITWNRPDALNAISQDLEREFHQALDIAAENEAIRSIIVASPEELSQWLHRLEMTFVPLYLLKKLIQHLTQRLLLLILVFQKP